MSYRNGYGSLKVFSGTANQSLVESICNRLDIPLGKVDIKHFKDGEIFVSFEENIRGTDCFLVQSTCNPVNNHLMELLIMIDAAKRSSASRITAVLPYYGYARQDRKHRPRVPISAKLVANLLTEAGADRIMTLDLHSGQIQGFFDIPLDNLYASKVLVKKIQKTKLEDLTIVAPDVGSVKRARAYAKHFDCPIAIIDKRRPKENESEVMHIIGEVNKRNCVIVDDMIDTAGTICQAAAALKKEGAKDVYGCATHPVFSGDAINKIKQSPFKKIWVTDTIPVSENKMIDKIKVVPLGDFMADAIRRTHEETTLSNLFLSNEE